MGSILFFSFIAAPVIFRTLDREEAARTVRALFPPYYRLGAICGAALVLSSGLAAVLSPAGRVRQGLVLIVAAAMLALTMYAWRVVLPGIESARVRAERTDPTDPTRLEHHYFRRLHTRSVRVNGAVLVLGLVCLVLTMGRV